MGGLPPGLVRGEDGIVRCFWAGSDPLYLRYHDREWGFPMADDRRLFEKICLERFQAGDVRRLLRDAGIVRHRGKIESTINNARRALALREEAGSLAAYFWRWEPGAEARPRRLTWSALRAMPTTPESTALSRHLKKSGWTFVGPTTVYAFMQAVGLVNDHLEGCAVREPVEAARR